MPRKKLPIGIQTFREIREDDCDDVDKTTCALKMIREGKACFLSRHRRFGMKIYVQGRPRRTIRFRKSLFLDTLAELLAGNEPLFRDFLFDEHLEHFSCLPTSSSAVPLPTIPSWSFPTISSITSCRSKFIS
jgi:hypothetical protein